MKPECIKANATLLIIMIIMVIAACSSCVPHKLILISGCEKKIYKLKRNGEIKNFNNPITKNICDENGKVIEAKIWE